MLLLADKTKGKILGCHIIGSEASVLIHEVLVAMRADDNGGTVDNIIKTVHIHPALSEVVARAAAGIRVAKAFEMNVLAWSQNLTEDKAAEHGAKLVSKEALFVQSDIISIHVILSERTRGLIGDSELRLMKPSALLVNTSRGPIVDEAALITALREKRIAGAAIDVFEQEPLPQEHAFRKLENVLATPHIGYSSESLLETFYKDTVSNIDAWIRSKN